MGLIGEIFSIIFGGSRNALRETVEVFRPNAEAQAVRDSLGQSAALAQFAAEFTQARKSGFDRLMDAINRLPRPMLALGTLGLFVSAMFNPVWFAQRMQGIALVPEPLWWLMAVIVSFYFGARHQTKSQDFQRGLAMVLANTPLVAENIRNLEALEAIDRGDPNPALDDWNREYGR